MSEIPLKKCPFCGAVPDLYLLKIICYGCGIVLFTRDNDELKEKWNRRVSDE